jgi:adenine-specific DNA-methyltransferase
MANKKTPESENTRMPLTSGDVTAERKDALRQLFPEVFAEGKIDFEKLKLVLGEDIDEGRERYGLTWAGKADAIRANPVSR